MKSLIGSATTEFLTASFFIVLSTGVVQATTLTLVSDGSTLAAATAASDPRLTTGDTSGLTFGADSVGGGTFTRTPPGAPANTDVINIDSAGGASGFFEINFTLPASFSFASISGAANTDDEGYVFVNGINLTPGGISEYGNVKFSSSTASLFHSGSNTLLVSDKNLGGPSGAAFFANVVYSAGVATPEPAVWPLTLSCLVLGVGAARWRRVGLGNETQENRG